MSVAVEGFVGAPRRKVTIRRDEEDYVIVLQPEDLLLFRNPSQRHFARPVIFSAGRLSAIPFRKRMTRRLGNIATAKLASKRRQCPCSLKQRPRRVAVRRGPCARARLPTGSETEPGHLRLKLAAEPGSGWACGEVGNGSVQGFWMGLPAGGQPHFMRQSRELNRAVCRQRVG